MTSTTISIDAQGPLLVVRVHGFSDELHQGTRIIDAVAAEGARMGTRQVLVDFSELDGMLTLAFHAELEHYAAVRLAGVKCAFVLPPEFAREVRRPPARARFAVFPTEESALEWLQGRVVPMPGFTTPASVEHTLVHLI